MDTVLVRGSGDIGSAVAHALFAVGYSVAIHDVPRPAYARRTMAFTDALFEGIAELDGIFAKRARTPDSVPFMLRCRGAIAVATGEIEKIAEAIQLSIVVDARMRKRLVPEPQRHLAQLSIGLGPNFTVGQNVDVAIETSWSDELGHVVRSGSTKPLQGEPSELGKLRRERFVYSPAAGTFYTSCAIGNIVEAGTEIGEVGGSTIRAPASGRLRGLTHDGAIVDVGTKIVEVDPRKDNEIFRGIADRPRRIAEGVLNAVIQRRSAPYAT